MPRLRCAIYTRKSTEDGLDQAFNSLDAQREACAAYIASQRHEGWKAIPDCFDDGGYSGGSMERPGLARLLDAVRNRQIDAIVVYKVDRLTRSLADFAKIVDELDAHDVSFVSVTQQFNTTSSMGRLTLNVLLSFAQFEREVTAERIRDKIAASKKKGIWTGGPVPLGYDVEDKALVPNPTEAKHVQRIFEIYLEVDTVRALQEALAREGIVTKRRKGVGRRAGGNPFSRGALYALLSNTTYIGRVAFKGEDYLGRHPPILDRDLWEAVQAKLKQRAPRRRSATNITSTSFLAGLLFDETGDRLTPTHASKAGKRYRYYVSSRLHLAQDRTGWRLPAPMLEDLIIDILLRWLADPGMLLRQAPTSDVSANAIGCVTEAAQTIRQRLLTSDQSIRIDLVKDLVQRIDVRPTEVRMMLRLDALSLAIGNTNTIELEEPARLRRRGVEAKLTLRTSSTSPEADPRLIALVARAHHWRDLLVSGEYQTLSDLAQAEGVSRWDVSRHLPLAYLAPDIVEAIVDGRQPISLTINALKRALPLPIEWAEQRRRLGFEG